MVGPTLEGALAGVILIQSGASISGFGMITGAAVADNGAIVAEGGMLTLAGGTSGAGTATIESGATLSANGSLSVASVAFASGSETLALTSPAAVTSVLSGFGAGDVIDLRHITATSLQFLGGVLTIKNGTATVGELTFRGAYTTADFALKTDGNGGTDIVVDRASALLALTPAGSGSQELTPQDLSPNTFANSTGLPADFKDMAATAAYHFTTYDSESFSDGN